MNGRELAEAIEQNNYDKVELSLKNGNKLTANDLGFAFGRGSNIDTRIIDLLGAYKALPSGVSVSTIKFISFLLGNRQIHNEDFATSDLNLNGCDGLRTPMQISIAERLKSYVEYLIQKGVQERPLFNLFLGIHTSHFNVSLIFLNDSKNSISKLFKDEDLIKQCEIAELLIKNPNENLDSEIEKNSTGWDRYRLFTFFAWLAINNRADLFEKSCFLRLYTDFSEAAGAAFKIAALFGSAEYIKNTSFITNVNAVRTGMIIACITGNLNILKCIVENIHVPLPYFLQKSADSDDDYSFMQHPLFWAIRADSGFWAARSDSASFELVKYFLECGVDPNMKFNDDECATLLHTALICKKWDVAILLIKDYNADIHIKNEEDKTPLDYIEDIADENIKNQILSFCNGLIEEKENKPKKTPLLPHLSFLAKNKAQTAEESQSLNAEKNYWSWCNLI